MKRIIILLALAFTAVSGFSQVPQVSPTKRLLLPKFTDTTAANLLAGGGKYGANLIELTGGGAAVNTLALRNSINTKWNIFYPGSEVLVATVSGINGLTASSTDLFTVPAGRNFIVTKVSIRVTTSTGMSMNPEFALQWNAGTTFALRAYSTTVLLANDVLTVSPGSSAAAAGITIVGQAAEVLKLKISTFGVGTAFTATADVFGYYSL